ncbi:MAG: hypothetical protein ACRDRW_07285 [Pseudonocardiaceae bacterium]
MPSSSAARLIGDTLFSILVVTTVVTTLAAGPLLGLLYSSGPGDLDPAELDPGDSSDDHAGTSERAHSAARGS